MKPGAGHHPHLGPENQDSQHTLTQPRGSLCGGCILSNSQNYRPEIYYFGIILGNQSPIWAAETIIFGDFNVWYVFLVILSLNFSCFQWKKLPKNNFRQSVPVSNYLFKPGKNYLGNFLWFEQ